MWVLSSIDRMKVSVKNPIQNVVFFFALHLQIKYRVESTANSIESKRYILNHCHDSS